MMTDRRIALDAGGYEFAVENRKWEHWPTCPSCNRRRQTVCPVCGVAGDGFPLADYLAPPEPLRGSRQADKPPLRVEEDGLEVLLICPQCDEAFPPSFYRYCAMRA